MRAAILNGANSNQLFQEIKPLLFLGVILLPAGIVVFNYVEKYAKKKGLLKRSG
jgi:ABC-2 type transport system permease protein